MLLTPHFLRRISPTSDTMLLVQTELGDCAEMYVSIAQNTSMTGQAVTVGTWHAFSSPRPSFSRPNLSPAKTVSLTSFDLQIRASISQICNTGIRDIFTTHNWFMWQVIRILQAGRLWVWIFLRICHVRQVVAGCLYSSHGNTDTVTSIHPI